MANLQLRLLGAFACYRAGTPIRFRSEKERALLAYLAVESNRAHHRNTLAALLWPEQSQEIAHTNLRVTLHRLRHEIGDPTEEHVLLEITREHVQFVVHQDVWVDVLAYQNLLKRTELHAHETLAACDECMSVLVNAADLYQGEFLEGGIPADSQNYAEWAFFIREQLLRQALSSLHHLAEYHRRRGELVLALKYAQRQLELEPWREEAHVQVMTILALQGERSAALRQYQHCQQILAEELGVEPAETTRALYERILALRERRNNLAAPASPFFGRKQELIQVNEILAKPAFRLLTILGPGGIGKSRLAQQAADAQTLSFLNGVFFVPLASVNTPEELLAAIYRALEFQPRAAFDPKEQLLDYLREKEILLILDNFEQLLRPGASPAVLILDALLKGAPNLHLLVTSRQSLNLSQERLLVLDGLAYPAGKDRIEAEQYAAVQLFLHSARRLNPDDQFDEAAITAAAEICRLLEGVPLAIELAAAWTRALPPAVVAQEIVRSLDFLTSTYPDLPERHRSLRATFEHSYSMLAQAEQQALRRLSVFPGSFDRHAAEEVAAASLQMLTSLCDRSLLARVRDKEGKTTPRYRLHTLIRQFCQEKYLQHLEDSDQTSERFCVYFLDYLKRRNDMVMGGSGMRQAIDEINIEIENVRLALDQAISRGLCDELSHTLNILFFYYEIHGLFDEAVQSFGRISQCIDESLKNETISSPGRRKYLGRAMIYQAVYSFELANFFQAQQLAQNGLQVSDQSGDQEGVGMALEALGIITFRQGKYPEAQRYLQQAAHILTQADHRWSLANVLGNLGLVTVKLGNHEQAMEFFSEALVLFDQHDDDWGRANMLGSLGNEALQVGDLEMAEKYFNQALVIRQTLGQRWLSALSLRSLGEVAQRRGQYAQAKQLFQESIVILRDYGERVRLAASFLLYGEACLELAERSAAREAFYQGLQLSHTLGTQETTIQALISLARLLVDEDRHEPAISILTAIANHPALESDSKRSIERLLGKCHYSDSASEDVLAPSNGDGQSLDEIVAMVLRLKGR